MNKISPTIEEATIEQILSDVSYYEYPDGTILLTPENDEGTMICISDYEGNNSISAPTIREALITMQINFWKKCPPYSDETFTCDWSKVWENNEIYIRK